MIELIIPDKSVSIADGGIDFHLQKQGKNWLWAQIEAMYEHFYNSTSSAPLNKLPEPFFEILMNGSGKQKFQGAMDIGFLDEPRNTKPNGQAYLKHFAIGSMNPVPKHSADGR